MSVLRISVVAGCVAALLAVNAAGASANAPRWWLKETGSLVEYSGTGGLVEATTPETLLGEGELAVTSKSVPKAEKPISNCLARTAQRIVDPAEVALPGMSEVEQFEIACEKGTGSLNAAFPPPCSAGEAFEMIGSVPWSAVLEEAGSKIYYELPEVTFTVNCLKSQSSAKYSGSLRAEVKLGRLRFLGASSGELMDPENSQTLNLKGYDYIQPLNYKNVRASTESGTSSAAFATNRGPFESFEVSWR